MPLYEIQHRPNSTFGRSASIKSNMNFDEPSRPLCNYADGWVIAFGNRLDSNFAFKRSIGVIQYRVERMRRVAIASQMVRR